MTDGVHATSLFAGAGRGLLADVRLRVDDGLIAAIEPAPALEAGRRLVIPALVNAHDHARPIASSFGTTDMPLESWILRSALGTPPDPYLAAAAAFGRSARGGCGTVMVHYTRPSGTMTPVDEARAIARAAADVGVRIAFALAVRDQNPIVYGDATGLLSGLEPAQRAAVEDLFVRPALPPRHYLDTVEAIAEAIAGPMVDVQLGPAGPQWCSRPLLEAIAEHSASSGRRIHMHLLETVYQRAWADREFPQGIVRHLAEIGFLSERTTLAHCIYARPDELDLIAQHDARIVTNLSSNLHIRSGLAPIADAHRRGCAVAVGVDGLALDEDDDGLREMRLVQLAHGGLGFEPVWSRGEFLDLAIRNGRAATGAPGPGTLTPGAPADYLVVDLDRLDRDAIMELDPVALLFARGNASHMAELVVAGRTVVRDGTVLGLDLDEVERDLRRLYRAAMPRYRSFLEGWRGLEAGVRDWNRALCGCQ